MTDEKYIPPEPDKGDAAYATGRALLSFIPVAGGAAVELFQFIVTPPVEKRRNEWMKEIGQAVQNLEQTKGVDVEQLKTNDVFIDTLLQASQIALRNSQLDKLVALKNAVINSALPLCWLLSHPPRFLKQKRTKPSTILNFTRSDLPRVPFALQFQTDEPSSQHSLLGRTPHLPWVQVPGITCREHQPLSLQSNHMGQQHPELQVSLTIPNVPARGETGSHEPPGTLITELRINGQLAGIR